METEDIIELGIIAAVLIAVAVILYEVFGFFKDSGATSALSSAGNGAASVLNAGASAIDTLTGGGSTSVPGSNSNLFYSGVENFFSTGSVYGNQGSQ